MAGPVDRRDAKYSGAPRKLSGDELRFLKILLSGNSELLRRLESASVQDMADGGMGSLLFISTGALERKLGRQIVEAEFLDRDGVLANAVVNLDSQGHLFELDVWKVDFSPLTEFPKGNDVHIKSAPSS